MTGRAPFMMTVTLDVLDHLGRNLYSNIPAVLSEAVANAWDADAHRVDITLDPSSQVIVIGDDGVGMDRKAVNDKYLTVGYKKRDHGETVTQGGRHVMGRKGIGKLSLFAIADEIEVQTVRAGKAPQAFTLAAAGIARAAKARIDYLPPPLTARSITIKKGTRLRLGKLRKTITAGTEQAIRTRLARRFSVIGVDENFRVYVNGTAIGPGDRDFFKSLQFIWSIGDVADTYEIQAVNAQHSAKLEGLVSTERGWAVSGWLGTFTDQRSVDPINNAVTVLAWGKLVHEDLLKDVKAGGIYTKYLIGELRADFLDLDNSEDIATSDRQSLKEDDPRVDELRSWFRTKVLAHVERQWSEWRGAQSLETALSVPAVRQWHDSLSADNRMFAARLFAKIGKLGMEDDESRRELYRNTILAFEKLRLKEALYLIDGLEPSDLNKFERVFLTIDDLEMVQYHSIANARLHVIRAFTRVAENEKEKVVQRFLFDHLWLLHPAWERPTTNKRIEQSVSKEWVKIKLSADERRGRLDIRYVSTGGDHVVIELKKYSVRADFYVLLRQMSKYRNTLIKVLQATHGVSRPSVRSIAILGARPADPPHEEQDRQLEAINARIITYDSLIADGIQSYSEYLAATEDLSRLAKVIESI
jgi:hypothetical protein